MCCQSAGAANTPPPPPPGPRTNALTPVGSLQVEGVQGWKVRASPLLGTTVMPVQYPFEPSNLLSAVPNSFLATHPFPFLASLKNWDVR
jgi:hypothetical protein